MSEFGPARFGILPNPLKSISSLTCHIVTYCISSLIHKRTRLPIIFFLICTRLSVFTQWSRYRRLAPHVQKIFPAHTIYFPQVLFEGQTVRAVLSMKERNRSTIYLSSFYLFFFLSEHHTQSFGSHVWSFLVSPSRRPVNSPSIL